MKIRISENSLHSIIKEAIKSVLTEAANLISSKDAEKQGFAIPKEHLQWKDGEFKEPKKKAIQLKKQVLANSENIQ